MVRNFTRQILTLTRLMINIALFSALLSSNAFALSQVTATVDKNPVMLNESILLTVIADDDIARNALDTSALLADFIVGQTSVSSQTTMVNFNTSRMTKWQILLIARRAGKFTIPALTIENMQSAPIELNVIEADKSSSAKRADIFVTSELSSQQVYVQQLLTLTIKVYFSVDLKSGSLTEPKFTGADIEKIGQDKQSDSIINGKRYRVIEQTYAITPEQSGEFTLPAPLFSGDVLQASQRRSNFLSFPQSKPVSILGNELKISVLPIPANYPANEPWLPTDILTLHQEWQSADTEFTVGEPITRTITLTAAGLAKAQLPKLKMKSSPGLKVYPDQAELHTNLNRDRLVSQKVQNFALVASAAGDFALPAMSITWFNTITNKIEQATLPAQTLSVHAAEAGYNTKLPSDTPKAANEITQVAELPTHLALPAATADINLKSEDKRLQWLFLGLWLLTALAWIVHIRYLKQNSAKNNNTSARSTTNTGNHSLALLAACKKNNAEQALNLILPWCKQLLNRANSGLVINNIAQAQAVIREQSFDCALNDLQQHLYGKSALSGAPSWQGLALLNAIQAVEQQQSEKVNNNQPLPLNP